MEEKDLLNVLQRMKEPGKGVMLKNRIWRVKTEPVKNCFVGKELVDWLLKNYPESCKSREQARKIGMELQH
jgi:hypothetical protein